MPKLPGQQVSRALYGLSRSPFRNPVSSPLCCSPQARHLHDSPAPERGRKKRQSRRHRRRIDPKDYDVLITGVGDDVLRSEISELVGIPYLEEAAVNDEADGMPDRIYGFVYGRMFRMIFPCLLSIEDKAHWVFFLVDDGAPLTYISTQVAQAFGLALGLPKSQDTPPGPFGAVKFTFYEHQHSWRRLPYHESTSPLD
ncbi:hypothetical protein GP486_002418 [Trichoglossum hirsutum]|uniref:Uncharacterized protein n=1 Tax=Trichoglossum hirsutum TaxID=265104 RepID=A0A9P8LEZ2_9PEZI|nr:hypothetical protein GP486_002418 [Trichoglossum hirsutum]